MNERPASELSDEIVDKLISFFLGHFNIEKSFLTKCSGGVNCAARPAGAGGNYFRRCFSRSESLSCMAEDSNATRRRGVSKLICFRYPI